MSILRGVIEAALAFTCVLCAVCLSGDMYVAFVCIMLCFINLIVGLELEARGMLEG